MDLCIYIYIDRYIYTVKPKIIHTPGKFGLKVTFIQPASFFLIGNYKGVSQKIIRRCTRGIIVEKNISQLLFTFEQKVARPNLFIPFPIINRKAFIGYYSNQRFPIIADQLFACLQWYFWTLIFSDELQLFQVGGSPCHHPDL